MQKDQIEQRCIGCCTNIRLHIVMRVKKMMGRITIITFLLLEISTPNLNVANALGAPTSVPNYMTKP